MDPSALPIDLECRPVAVRQLELVDGELERQPGGGGFTGGGSDEEEP